MIAVGIWLLSVGLADLVAGLSGEPKDGARTIGAIVTGVVAPAILCGIAGADVGTLVMLTLLTGATTAVWIVIRRDAPRMSAVRALVALLFLLAAFAIVSAIGSEPVSTFATGSLLERGVHHLPFPLVAGASLEQVLFVAGVLVMLFATSNAIVRLVLTAMGTRFSNAEQRLRGGRVIGPLERVLDLRPGTGRTGDRGCPRDRRQGPPALSGVERPPRRIRRGRTVGPDDRRRHRVPADRIAHELAPRPVPARTGPASRLRLGSGDADARAAGRRAPELTRSRAMVPR